MKTLGLRDVIGPVMVGPSSSHTAGALAIASMARRLCGSKPVQATFTLYGSFAHTGCGHGTDKALVAGLLGLSADDLSIRNSFELARQAHFSFDFAYANAQGEKGFRGNTCAPNAGHEPGQLAPKAEQPAVEAEQSAAGTRQFASKVEQAANGADHPNTVDIRIVEEDGNVLDVRGVSIGGGAAVLTRIDGIEVNVTGEHTNVVVRQHDERGVLAHIATCLADWGVNIATTRMYRTRKGSNAYTIMETDDAVPAEVRAAIENHPAVRDVRVIPAARAEETRTDADEETGASAEKKADAGKSSKSEQCANAAVHAGTETDVDADERFARCDFTTGTELLARCGEQNCSIAHAFREREHALCALDGRQANIDAYLARALKVMRDSATTPLANPLRSMGGLIGGEAQQLACAPENGHVATAAILEPARKSEFSATPSRATTTKSEPAPASPAAMPAPTANTPSPAPLALLDPLSATACVYALAVLETNASMGRIVAAPTAGSAGVVPAVLLALQKHRGFSDAELYEGLLTAGAIGYLISRNASVSGAEGGCQAEIGSAAAMAAAAAVEMAGGTPNQALAAASNALTSLMGLVCDPVGGLVEIPCQKRNATAALTALACAQIALAGIENLVNFDETVEAMYRVGRTLPFELRESALGGIAATPSACAWCAKDK